MSSETFLWESEKCLSFFVQLIPVCSIAVSRHLLQRFTLWGSDLFQVRVMTCSQKE